MSQYHLFDAVGIEVEAAIVDLETLNIRPWADRVFIAVCGEPVCEYDRGATCWNNELAAHVIEVKTSNPVSSPAERIPEFQKNWNAINTLLAKENGTLLPGPVHPWMNPKTETVLWPHEQGDWYRMFDRLFDCHRHGWANLQSIHLNFPFFDDAEFARLHAAVRLILPILPALSAASPYLDGAFSGFMDMRLEVYRINSLTLPEAVGQVIPEPAYSRQAYAEMIMAPLFDALAPMDPEGLLREEWLNARGAIARFDRKSIEIRVIDSQECALADLSIAHIVFHVLKALVDHPCTSLEIQQNASTDSLEKLFLQTVQQAEATPIDDLHFLQQFGCSEPMTAFSLWQSLFHRFVPTHKDVDGWIEHYLKHGTLARRLFRYAGHAPSQQTLRRMVQKLIHCQKTGTLFEV